MCDPIDIWMTIIAIYLGMICVLLVFVLDELKKQTKWMEED